MSNASVSVIVDKLVKRAFLKRKQDRADRRRWLLQASPAAIAKVDAVYAAHASRVEKLLDGYSDHEFEVVLRFMDTFADELKLTAGQLAMEDPMRSRG
jgi:DNA-binding MarR family transcriptional regulator